MAGEWTGVLAEVKDALTESAQSGFFRKPVSNIDTRHAHDDNSIVDP
jgi:hypothetical protein